jgi:hypothetical protein
VPVLGEGHCDAVAFSISITGTINVICFSLSLAQLSLFCWQAKLFIKWLSISCLLVCFITSLSVSKSRHLIWSETKQQRRRPGPRLIVDGRLGSLVRLGLPLYRFPVVFLSGPVSVVASPDWERLAPKVNSELGI